MYPEGANEYLAERGECLGHCISSAGVSKDVGKSQGHFHVVQPHYPQGHQGSQVWQLRIEDLCNISPVKHVLRQRPRRKT